MNFKPARLQRHGLLLLCCSVLCLAPWSLWAQQSPMPEPPAAPQTSPAPEPATQIEEHKLDQFADAFIVVQEIQRSALERLEHAADERSASQLKAQAESDAIAAVEKAGLPLVEFNQIAQAMMTDVALRDKVAERVARRRAPPLPTS